MEDVALPVPRPARKFEVPSQTSQYPRLTAAATYQLFNNRWTISLQYDQYQRLGTLFSTNAGVEELRHRFSFYPAKQVPRRVGSGRSRILTGTLLTMKQFSLILCKQSSFTVHATNKSLQCRRPQPP